MMTIDEMIAVLQAYKEGKTIEFYASTKEWLKCVNPVWDFENINYRVKPGPHYRPFESVEEVMEAIKEHGDCVKQKNNGAYVAIRSFYNEYMCIGTNAVTYLSVFDKITFADGTPFGKLVDE